VNVGESAVPASELAAARAQIAQLKRMLGQEDDGGGNSQGSGRDSSRKKVGCAITLIGQERPVKAVCSALGVARSNICLLAARPANWVDGRTNQS
jgi:hypothetical protein